MEITSKKLSGLLSKFWNKSNYQNINSTGDNCVSYDVDRSAVSGIMAIGGGYVPVGGFFLQ